MSEDARPPMYVQEGPNAGMIADPNVAQEIANLEKPARDRELGLQREAETGLNPEQEKNVAIMEGLQEKYPKAFSILVDDRGRKALLANVGSERGKSALFVNQVFVCQEGMYGINNDVRLEPDDIDPGKLIDALPKMDPDFQRSIGEWAGYPKDKLNPTGAEKVRHSHLTLRKLDLSRPATREGLQATFMQEQNDAIYRETQAKEFKEKMDPAKILEDL